MAFLKPQSPMKKGDDYFYPLTTVDQILVDGGYRLNQILGKTKEQIITLRVDNWSQEKPYTQNIIVAGLQDQVQMNIYPIYPDDYAEKITLKNEYVKINYCTRENDSLLFECWDEIPNVDLLISVEIYQTTPFTTHNLEELINSQQPQINYNIIQSDEEPVSPSENMIWVNNTTHEITNHIFSRKQPKNPENGMLWIEESNDSNIVFHTLIINDLFINEVSPIAVYQFNNGAWEKFSAKIYQNGLWAEMEV